MGTVGLNFGSPTSGAGFNVSSTVSAIMANLQNVETPWKTQITSIDSQDAVISSLGTLLSKLSTDMTTLTDATGVLSEKAGSSSNNSVVELTTASSAAVAGTHTVVVSQLAATSSGYLAEMKNANDTLAGSITIQVGSGSVQTISITSSNNTLASLAKSINSAGIGVTAAVLTDASGSRLSIVSGTSGTGGELTISSAISDTGNTAAATATAMSYTSGATSDFTLDAGTLGPVALTTDKLGGSVVLQVGTGTAKTITLDGTTSTLDSLKTAINAANLGVTASIVTDSTTKVSTIALTSQIPGAAGKLTVTGTYSDVTSSSALSYTDASISNTLDTVKLGTTAAGSGVALADKLSGSVVLQVGTGAAKTITLDGTTSTLSSLETAINSSNLGVTASIVQNTDLSYSISLLSQVPGSAGKLTVTGSNFTDGTTALTSSDTGNVSLTAATGTLGTVAHSYDTLSGSVALTVNGTATTITLTSADNTLTGLMTAINSANLGVTASIVTNSTTGLSSISLLTQNSTDTLNVTSSLSDNVPTTLGFTNSVAGANASLVVDGVTLTVSSNTVTGLIPGLTFQLLSTSTSPVQVIIANYNSGVETTVAALVTDYNSLISAMNAQEKLSSSNTVQPLFGSPTLSMLQQDILGGVNMVNPNGYIDSVSTSANTTLSGSIAIQVGTAAAQTFTLTSTVPSLAGLAAAINAKNIGVTASVVTTNGTQSLTLASQLAGTSGALTVSSALVTKAPTALTYSSLTDVSGNLGNLTTANSGDKLSGTLAIAFGTNAAQTITLDSTDNTLAKLADAITNSSLGVTATVIPADGSTTPTGLLIVSKTGNTNGSMSVSSTIADITNQTTKSLNYNASSDIGGLTGLGISVNTDGTLSLDVTTLDSVLNADYSGVAGLFQNANSWGATFNTMLTNAGTTSTTGVAALALKANSSIEATLNADISREDALISSETKSLTAELNSANQVLQSLPAQLSQVNELYSAITGYNQSSS